MLIRTNMIYLIEDHEYLKIGYAKDVQQRLKGYQTHNLHVKLLSKKVGTRKDENILHELCKEFQYQGEWFYNCQEVKDIFYDYKSVLITELPNIKTALKNHATWIKGIIKNEHPSIVNDTDPENYTLYLKYKEAAQQLQDYFELVKKEDSSNVLEKSLEYYKYYLAQKNALIFYNEPEAFEYEKASFKILEDETITIEHLPNIEDIKNDCLDYTAPEIMESAFKMLTKCMENKSISDLDKIKLLSELQIKEIQIINELKNQFGRMIGLMEKTTTAIQGLQDLYKTQLKQGD